MNDQRAITKPQVQPIPEPKKFTPQRDGALTLEAQAKTFRYLDSDEVSAQRKAAPKGAAGAKK